MPVTFIHPEDRVYARHTYVIGFAYHRHYLVYSNELESALEMCAAHLATHAPGMLMQHGSPEMIERVQDACETVGVPYVPEGTAGLPDRVWDLAMEGLWSTDSGYIRDDEWCIELEDPTRQQLKEFIKDCGGVEAGPTSRPGWRVAINDLVHVVRWAGCTYCGEGITPPVVRRYPRYDRSKARVTCLACIAEMPP